MLYSRADSYKDETVAGIEFERIYNFLNDIHTNYFDKYFCNHIIEDV